MGINDALYGGSINDFADSMAQEIENAYNTVLVENGKDPLPSGDSNDRRMLFIAISRGVINHLQKKQMAIKVRVAATDAEQTVTPEIVKR